MHVMNQMRGTFFQLQALQMTPPYSLYHFWFLFLVICQSAITSLSENELLSVKVVHINRAGRAAKIILIKISYKHEFCTMFLP